MEIPGWVINLAVGSIAAFVALKWRSSRNEIVASAMTLDDRLETRLGVKAPAWVHNIYHSIISKAASAIDSCVSDGPFIRNVIRAIIAKDPSKLPDIEAKFKKIDWTGDVDAQIPAEYKEAYNTVKEDACVKAAVASMKMNLDTANVPSEAAVREMVKVGVAANKIKDPPITVTPELLERLIQESKDRQAKLSK